MAAILEKNYNFFLIHFKMSIIKDKISLKKFSRFEKSWKKHLIFSLLLWCYSLMFDLIFMSLFEYLFNFQFSFQF